MRLFDLHCDTIYECYQKGECLAHNNCAVDIGRGSIRYQPWIQVFAVWIPDTVRGEQAWHQCHDMILYAQKQARRSANGFCFAKTHEDVLKAFLQKQSVGLLAVESGAALGGIS